MDWYAASGKQSDIHWTEDRMEGSFTVWHQNGKLKVVGQTKDGEVDGSWAEYYPDGQLAYRSTNKMGHQVDIRVWNPDGSICEESNVIEGNGSFYAISKTAQLNIKESSNMEWKPPGRYLISDKQSRTWAGHFVGESVDLGRRDFPPNSGCVGNGNSLKE